MKNSAFDDFSEGAMEIAYDAYDFKTCQRSDGTTYGTSGDCTQLGSKEVKKGSTSKKVSKKAKQTQDAFSVKNIMAKAGVEQAQLAFGFGNFIKAVGGAAGVAPITDIIGGAVHETEVKRTNQMLQDNAAKAQAAARISEAAAINPEIRDYQEAMRSTTDPAEKAMIGEMLEEMVADVFAQKAAKEAKAAQAQAAKTSGGGGGGNSDWLSGDPRWQKAEADFRATTAAAGIRDGMTENQMTPNQQMVLHQAKMKMMNVGHNLLNEATAKDSGMGIGVGDIMAMEGERKIQERCQYAPDVNGCLRIEKNKQRNAQKMFGGNLGGLLGNLQ